MSTSPALQDHLTSPKINSPTTRSLDESTTPPVDPKVAELHLMFPTVEPSVIQLILESSDGSTDQAIEQLLQMTDPEFKSDELPVVQREEGVSSPQSD